MREQIKGVFDFSKLEELFSEYIEDNTEELMEIFAESINNRLKFK